VHNHVCRIFGRVEMKVSFEHGMHFHHTTLRSGARIVPAEASWKIA
jgi:hypothetical protein